jgi:hypothetical protein
VARSASHQIRARAAASLASLAALAAAGALTGCSTTQQEAARLQLNSARIRASEIPTRVTAAGQTVRVARVAVVTSGGQTAFIVQVQNPTTRPVSDLPISVGVRIGARRTVYVNSQSPQEYSYFDAHLPVVAARGTLTWVYTTGRRLPAHSRPFAIVGGQPSPAVPGVTRLPVIRASAVTGPPSTAAADASSQAASPLAIALHNLSGVPQYQLQVYAFAQTAGRYVAAGDITVPHLGSQGSARLRLGLLGSLGHARLQIEALPTIFQ